LISLKADEGKIVPIKKYRKDSHDGDIVPVLSPAKACLSIWEVALNRAVNHAIMHK
jgi:hypothetical protein